MITIILLAVWFVVPAVAYVTDEADNVPLFVSLFALVVAVVGALFNLGGAP